MSTNPDWLDDGPGARDLVIAADGVPEGLDHHMREGGRLLVAGASPPALDMPAPVQRWENTRSAHFRVHDHELFPSLADANLVFVDGEYLEFAPPEKPLLTLIPPSRFGPPE